MTPDQEDALLEKREEEAIQEWIDSSKETYTMEQVLQELDIQWQDIEKSKE